MSLVRMLIVFSLAMAAFAWDAGPKVCRHNECTGGVNAGSVLDTQPRYAASQLPSATCPAGTEFYGGLCYKACDTGWHRTAVCTCKKNGGGIFDLWTDCGRFGSSGGPTRACPAGTDSYGGLCYAGCPAGSVRTALSTCRHDLKWRSNTHLFVVNRAIELLAKTNDPIAAAAVQKMNTASCRVQWEGGLWDADDGNLSETGGARGTHFYNGGGKDFLGNATKVVTYMLGLNEQNAGGNARQAAKKYLAAAANLSSDANCYQLGLSLHYLTDMTQPMHASSFSAADIPTSQHPAFEDYVGNVQGRFPTASMTWDQRWRTMIADDVFHQTAAKANSLAPSLAAVIKYEGTICTMTTEPDTPVTYTGRCFVNEKAAIDKIGELLRDAYQSTASYIYTAFRQAAGS